MAWLLLFGLPPSTSLGFSGLSVSQGFCVFLTMLGVENLAVGVANTLALAPSCFLQLPGRLITIYLRLQHRLLRHLDLEGLFELHYVLFLVDIASPSAALVTLECSGCPGRADNIL